MTDYSKEAVLKRMQERRKTSTQPFSIGPILSTTLCALYILLTLASLLSPSMIFNAAENDPPDKTELYVEDSKNRIAMSWFKDGKASEARDSIWLGIISTVSSWVIYVLACLSVIMTVWLSKSRDRWFYFCLWPITGLFFIPAFPIGTAIGLLLAIHLIRKRTEYFQQEETAA